MRYWVCWRCSYAYWADANRRVVDGLTDWLDSGRDAVFLTFTITHNRNTLVADKVTALRGIWSEMTGDGVWQRLKKKYGIEASYKALEISLGKQGLNPHTHMIWLTNNDLDKDAIEAIHKALTKLYIRVAKRLGYGIPGKPVDVQSVYSVGIADYLTKGSLGAISELSRRGLAHGDKSAREMMRDLAKYTENVPGAVFFKHPIWGKRDY